MIVEVNDDMSAMTAEQFINSAELQTLIVTTDATRINCLTFKILNVAPIDESSNEDDHV